MTEQGLRRAGLASFGLCVLLVASMLHLSVGIDGSPGLVHDGFRLEPTYVLVVATLFTAAVLLVWARPRNAVGWLLGASGLAGALCEWGQVYGTHALVVPGSSLPLGELVLSWSAPLWVVSLFLPATVLLARYPSGHLQPGPWPRRVERTTVATMLVLWVMYAGSLQSTTDEVSDSSPPVLLPESVTVPALVGCAVVLLLCSLAVVGATVRRLVRADWPERPQLVLLVTAVTLSVVVVFVSPYEWLGMLAFGLLPLAVVVGVMRYRLMGIEVVVRRALLYGALTGTVLVVFVAVTSLLASLVPDGPAPQVLAASVVAVLLAPARDWLQRAVDRLLYGDRADPWAALGRLGREAVQGDSLTDVVTAVAQGLRLPGAQVRGADGTTAGYGDLGTEPLVVPLVVADEEVGALLVSPRRGERALGAADDRLLRALAPLVALVLRDTVLTAALRTEKERVVQATQDERARLRRDLHDGLGPSLTGIGLGLEAVDAGALPDRSQAVVARLRSEVSASLEEVRRIIDDLRPGALETGDLLSLLRSRAAHLSATSPLRVEVVAPRELPPLPAAVEAAALRIVEEALTNVVRHARATTCTVMVAHDGALRLEVVDDGVGSVRPREGGVGLSSMRSRASALGGHFELDSTGTGTRVSVELPLGVPA